MQHTPTSAAGFPRATREQWLALVGKVLKGEELEAFMRERTRIDELLKDEDGDSLKIASANGKLGG